MSLLQETRLVRASKLKALNLQSSEKFMKWLKILISKSQNKEIW